MTELQPGQTVPFAPEGPQTTLTVDVRWDPSGTGLDASALLLTAAEKVRSDDDFVFFNQPQSPEGTVRHSSIGPGHERLELVLGQLGRGIERVLLAASVDAAAPNATFSQVRGLSVTVTARGTAEKLTFAVPQLTTETALRLAEVYPRGGQWRVRAVAQGYATGLRGLATEVGINVDDAPEAATPAQPTSTTNGRQVAGKNPAEYL